MKVQTLPSWSAAALEQKKLPPPGSAYVLQAGAERALAIPVDAATLRDPAHLDAALKRVVGVALDPQTVKRLNALSGALKDSNTMVGLAYPGHHLPVAGALDGFAIVTSSVGFIQALHADKGTLQITLAGAEMVANITDAFVKSPATTIVATVIRNVNRGMAAAAPGKPAATLPPVATHGSPPSWQTVLLV